MIGGGIDMSVGSLISLSTCIAAVVMKPGTGLSLALGILAVFLVAGIVGLCNGIGANYAKVPPLITTLSMMILLSGVAQGVLPVAGGKVNTGFAKVMMARAGIFSVSILILLIVYLIIRRFMYRTPTGVSVYAIGNNADIAASMGVRAKRVSVLTYVIAALCAAVTGLLGVGAESADIALTPGGILKVASKKIAVEKIIIGGNTEGIKEGESRTFTAACTPSDADGDIKWTIAAAGGSAQDSDVHLTENAGGSATVTLRRAGGTSSEYKLTATDEESGVSASVTLTTSVIDGEEIRSILPIGDVITADVEAVKANGINSSQLDDVAKSLGASMGSFKVNERGVVYLEDAVLQRAIVDAISDDSVALDRAVSLPLFRAQLPTAGATAATAFIISGDRLLADTPQEVRLVKTRPDGTGSFFAYAAASADYKDGHFTLQRMDDSVMAAEEAIEADKSYKLVVYVKDGGDYDVDSTERSVVDPLAVVKTSKKSSGGSGGCSAGFGALALLPVAFAALLRRRYRNGRRQ